MMAEEVVAAADGRNIETVENIADNGDEQVGKEHSFLRKMLNKTFRIRIADGRTLIGPEGGEEARILGLAMIPGRHIVSIDIDTNIPEFRTEDRLNSYCKLQSVT